MIGYIKGELTQASPLLAVVEAGGIGYLVNISLQTAEKLPPIGSPVKLLTQMVVREDSQSLYGFSSQTEKDAFIALTEKVSGIGPKIALNILSRITVDSLKSAIMTENVHLLTQCPGIGKKTAERLVLELKDVFAKETMAAPEGNLTGPMSGLGNNSIIDDVIAALVTLGFKPADAAKKATQAHKKAPEDATIEQILKIALKS